MKGFVPIILVLVVVILVGLAGGAYLLLRPNATSKSQTVVTQIKPSPVVSPTPAASTDETANWKTYTDPYYNFTLKYPSNWYTSKLPRYPDTEYETEFTEIPYDQIIPGGENPKTGKGVTSLSVSINNSGIPSRSNPYDNGRSDNPTLHDITLNSYKGWRSWNIHGTDFVTLINPHGGYASLAFGYFQLNSYIESPIFNQILSTFRFIDQAASPTP